MFSSSISSSERTFPLHSGPSQCPLKPYFVSQQERPQFPPHPLPNTPGPCTRLIHPLLSPLPLQPPQSLSPRLPPRIHRLLDPRVLSHTASAAQDFRYHHLLPPRRRLLLLSARNIPPLPPAPRRINPRPRPDRLDLCARLPPRAGALLPNATKGSSSSILLSHQRPGHPPRKDSRSRRLSRRASSAVIPCGSPDFRGKAIETSRSGAHLAMAVAAPYAQHECR